MFRKIATTVALFILFSCKLQAYSTQSYVQLYNYTEQEVTLYVDGTNCGTIPASYSPSWIPAPYGLHKVEVYKLDGWHNTYKYCETSYSYPNASVTFGTGDL